jgi:hypothetical protein
LKESHESFQLKEWYNKCRVQSPLQMTFTKIPCLNILFQISVSLLFRYDSFLLKKILFPA